MSSETEEAKGARESKFGKEVETEGLGFANLFEAVEAQVDKTLEELDELMAEVNALREEETELESTEFTASTPFGEVRIDYEEFADAVSATKRVAPPEVPEIERRLEAFFEGPFTSIQRYWGGNLGPIMKSHFDSTIEDRYVVELEKNINGKVESNPIFATCDLGEFGTFRYMALGYRFMTFQDEPSRKIVIHSFVDNDGDQNINLFLSADDVEASEFAEEMVADFYDNGPLNGNFFDIKFNMLHRSKSIEDLIAWNENIKQTLVRDVIDFQRVMPLLAKNGLSNSRGILLSGPPGTGKTLICKWLASMCNITTIVISAELVAQRYDVKQAYQLARRLSPAIIIIEDIDAAGALDRAIGDHPILGEFLQCLDGMSSNDGIITIATTNHSEKLDPAIIDRPGRFDRIVEVGLPDLTQRKAIFDNVLTMMPSKVIASGVINGLAKKTEGLTGAWIREVCQTALIFAITDSREEIEVEDLEESLKDVLSRRGMAYVPTPKLSDFNGATSDKMPGDAWV